MSASIQFAGPDRPAHLGHALPSLAFAAELQRLRRSPENSHLKACAGDDAYSGTLAAINVRRTLRAAYPDYRFDVRKVRPGCVLISWRDGPTVAQLEGAVGQHRAGLVDLADNRVIPITTPFTQAFGGAGCLVMKRSASDQLIEVAIAAVLEELHLVDEINHMATIAAYRSGILAGQVITLQDGTVQSLQHLVRQRIDSTTL